VALHAIGFGILLLVVAPHHFRLGSADTFAIGTGITAYTLGLRHAFDADADLPLGPGCDPDDPRSL